MAPINIQTQDHRDLLDIIDKLRSQGISRYVPLPEIIVCGDQSAGKSSVLEAISGLSFPTKDKLCTRFATELVMRRDGQSKINVSITPHHSRPKAEAAKLSQFTATLDVDDPDLAPVIESAKQAMGLSDEPSTTARRFSNDVLRIELSGPEQPHLTLVDLPGIFRAGNLQQSEAEAPIVQKLVLDYMKRPRSIILAVVSAGYDFANQEVTRFSRLLDPQGVRTMGLITKPDRLDRGSDSERAFVDLAENKDVRLNLGWHVLKNRSFEMRLATSAERDESEAVFFSEGAWRHVNPAHLGVATLRPRLSRILTNQILAQLPDMLNDINAQLEECNRGLGKLGESRTTEKEQRKYLTRVSLAFMNLVQAAIGGAYTDEGFFGDPLDSSDYYKRLRSVIQNTLTTFAETMHREGHTRIVVEDDADIDTCEREVIFRSDFIDEVKVMMTNLRGCELPGMFSPVVVGRLFRRQCENWPDLAHRCAQATLDAAFKTLVAALGFTAVPDSAEKILQFHIKPAMDDLHRDLTAKIEELVVPHRDGHPITYNHYLTDNVQKARKKRLHADLAKSLKSFYGVDSLDSETMVKCRAVDLFQMLAKTTEPDMMRLASSDAIDYMEAYYKVALKSFIDEVSVLAVERCLIQKLPTLFTPDMVYDISTEQVARLAGETPESAHDRKYLTEKRDILEEGLSELRQLDKHRVYETRDVGDVGSILDGVKEITVGSSRDSSSHDSRASRSPSPTPDEGAEESSEEDL